MIRSVLIAFALGLLVAACAVEADETTNTTKTQRATPTPKEEPATPKEEPVKTTPKALTFEMQISGMSCDGCKTAVTNLIQDVPGVESALVDLKTGKAVVKTKPGAKVDEATLKAAVDSDYKVESCKVAN